LARELLEPRESEGRGLSSVNILDGYGKKEKRGPRVVGPKNSQVLFEKKSTGLLLLLLGRGVESSAARRLEKKKRELEGEIGLFPNTRKGEKDLEKISRRRRKQGKW